MSGTQENTRFYYTRKLSGFVQILNFVPKYTTKEVEEESRRN